MVNFRVNIFLYCLCFLGSQSSLLYEEDQGHGPQLGMDNATLRMHMEFRRGGQGSLMVFDLGSFSLAALTPPLPVSTKPSESILTAGASGIKPCGTKGVW